VSDSEIFDALSSLADVVDSDALASKFDYFDTALNFVSQYAPMEHDDMFISPMDTSPLPSRVGSPEATDPKSPSPKSPPAKRQRNNPPVPPLSVKIPPYPKPRKVLATAGVFAPPLASSSSHDPQYDGPARPSLSALRPQASTPSLRTRAKSPVPSGSRKRKLSRK